jgi:hypothetical protein
MALLLLLFRKKSVGEELMKELQRIDDQEANVMG